VAELTHLEYVENERNAANAIAADLRDERERWWRERSALRAALTAIISASSEALAAAPGPAWCTSCDPSFHAWVAGRGVCVECGRRVRPAPVETS
jgi:hypothetical protein